MKTAHDPRHKNRIVALKELFAFGFNSETELNNPLAKQVVNHIERIDRVVISSAPEWPIAQINKIDLAILRLAVFELTVESEQPAPYKVVVDESVELAKEFGSDASPSFINGVLGKVVSEFKLEKKII